LRKGKYHEKEELKQAESKRGQGLSGLGLGISFFAQVRPTKSGIILEGH
jgi:hypothetical protein